MAETPPLELNHAQIAILQNLLKAGFELVTLEHVARYLPVQKDRFVALLDPSGGRLAIFGQIGYRMGEGVAMLVERREGKSFVWKDQSVPATSELLDAYERFKSDLEALLLGPAQ
jgi:hypothetical protein